MKSELFSPRPGRGGDITAKSPPPRPRATRPSHSPGWSPEAPGPGLWSVFLAMGRREGFGWGMAPAVARAPWEGWGLAPIGSPLRPMPVPVPVPAKAWSLERFRRGRTSLPPVFPFGTPDPVARRWGRWNWPTRAPKIFLSFYRCFFVCGCVCLQHFFCRCLTDTMNIGL